MVKHLRLTSVITSLLMLASGYFLAVNPKTSIKLICTAIAVCFLVLAATRFVTYISLKKESPVAATSNLVLAVILVIAALLFFFHPFSITDIIPIALGIIMLANGIILIVTGAVYRAYLPKHGIISILIGLLSVGLGYYAISNPFATQIMFMRYVGIAFIISGACNLLNEILALIGAQKARKAEEKSVQDVEYTTEPNNDEQ